MNTLSYNNPERAKERANVVPPDAKEMEIATNCLNSFIGFAEAFAEDESDKERTYDLFQRLLDDYENLRHFKDNAGGWQGLNALQVNYEIVASCVCSKCGSPMEIDYSKVLTSMPPKRQVNCTNEKCKSVAYIKC